MPNVFLRLTLALVVVASLSGCAKKASDTAATFSSDSLIASDPVEPPSGNLTPDQPFETGPAPPSSAPRHEAHAARSPSKTSHPPVPQSAPQEASAPSGSPPHQPHAPDLVVEYDTVLLVSVADSISSETVKAGDSWRGTVAKPVQVGDRIAIPAGSPVRGTVLDAKPAQAGTRAMLKLQVAWVDINGSTYAMIGTGDPIVAASPRTRNVGAIVGSAAAGALIGGAIGGGKGAAVGGVIGGATAGGAVARSKGYQAVVAPGTVLPFMLDKSVAVKP
jgi:hypothetical protein